MERFLRFRWRQNWGHFERIKDEEYRSYADGTIRRFQHRRQPDGSKEREFVGSRRPLEAEWAALIDVMDRYNAWLWTTKDFIPFEDGYDWSLRVVDGDREVRINSGWGFPPDFHEVTEAVERLVHGADGQLPEDMQ